MDTAGPAGRGEAKPAGLDPVGEAQMSEGPPPPQSGSDVFTVLLAVATVFVVVATVYTSVRANELFGSWLPFGPGF